MSSTCWQITFTPNSETPAGFADFLDTFFAVNAQNYSDTGYDEYVGYCDADFNEQQMLDYAAALNINLPPYHISCLTSDNWLKDYCIKFDPFEIADFCIYGIHETSTPKTNKIPIQIYAATAFGSNHQTTQCCIQAISDLYASGFSPKHILDIGTGSGILSLCAAKLWPNTQIIAGDIDDEAVIVTTGNAQTNNLSSQIKAIQSDGYQHDLICKHRPSHLILSNILANPLIAFASDLSQNLSSKGYCIISGFVDNQTDDVISAHETQQLKLIKLYSHDNWRAALMQKA